jgi:hypothetical protein
MDELFSSVLGLCDQLVAAPIERRDMVWHGFDRFRGLPRAWRTYEQGAFDASGKPPAIDDERVQWRVGDVEDPSGAVYLVAARDAQWLVLFDMGVYEPMAFDWEVIRAHLRPADVIYFDDEGSGIEDKRRLLDEAILPAIGCEPVSATAAGRGFVVSRHLSRTRPCKARSRRLAMPDINCRRTLAKQRARGERVFTCDGRPRPGVSTRDLACPWDHGAGSFCGQDERFGDFAAYSRRSLLQ